MKDAFIWLLVVGGALFLFGGGMVSSRTRKIAFAIAVAERGYDEILSGSIQRNNPGDIKDTVSGQIATYSTLVDGWNALYHQVDLMLNGQSHYYRPDMSIMDVAKTYVGTSDWPNWALNVASTLGVSPTTPLDQIV